MTHAATLPGFQPLATLIRQNVIVEFQLADGSTVQGWMARYRYVEPAYWQRIGVRFHPVSPVAWRPIPFPIAQRSAA